MTQPPSRAVPDDGPDSGRRLVGATALRFLVGVAVVAALVALSLGGSVLQPAADTAADDSFVRLERHGCLGTCPQFVVTVCSDGRVEYVGERFVDRVGRVAFTVPEPRARRLFSLAREVGYFDFRPEYRDNLVDDRTASMVVGRDGRTHRVDFEPDAGPDGLHRLADAVESEVRSSASQRDRSGEFYGEVRNATATC